MDHALIDEIREKFRRLEYEYSLHAVDRSIEKRILRREIEEEDMKCEVCGIGERELQLIDYSLRLLDRLVVAQHVPASVCNRCGETSLDPETVERLQQTVWQSQAPVRVLETPVYDFEAGSQAL